jgi:hypothetical protein
MITAYPGCPTLSWMIAKRVTNPYEDADAFISFTGRKGSSKTTSSSALCEGIAEDVVKIRWARAKQQGIPWKKEDPEKFFNIDHVRSITEVGALDLLSSGALEVENSIFLLDDTGTQWGARNFQSPINKTLNSILQICRIYRCVIVANFILQTHIDIQARGMADFRAEMQYKNTRDEQAVFKFYYLEQGVKRGKPQEYKKYLTWNGKRIKQWVIGKPSPKFEAQMKQIRKDNTREFVAAAKKRVQEIMGVDTEGEPAQSPKAGKREKLTEKKWSDIAKKHGGTIREMLGEEASLKAITRKTGLSEYELNHTIAKMEL